MRGIILDFLKQQQPRIIYEHREKTGVFGYVRRVWLSPQEEVLSLSVVYTRVSVLSVDCVHNAATDKTFYGRLGGMIRKHPSYEEASRYVSPDVEAFAVYFLHGFDLFVEDVKKRSIGFGQGCRLRNFECVDATLGFFSILFEIDGVVEYSVLVMGHKNYMGVSTNQSKAMTFFDHLFGDSFMFVWDTNAVE